MTRKVTLLDENPGPNLLQQLIFLDNVPGAFNQHEESFQVLGRNGNSCAVVKQHTLVRVKPE